MRCCLIAVVAANLLRSGGVTLDVGLDRFIQNLTSELGNATEPLVPTKDRAAFHDIVAKDVALALANGSKTVKMAIGKNWVQLKEEKRDSYIKMVQDKFSSIFADSLTSFKSHVGLVVKAGAELPDNAARQKTFDYALQAPSKLLFKQLQDYQELLYMSSIFLQFHSKTHPSLLQMSSVHVM
jgi:hypothetical protein